MAENPERSPQPREMRPKAAGHVWAWIIVAVGSVIFLAIALWVIVAGKTQVETLAGRDGVHVVASRWADRWAQAPGPPAAYRLSAETAEKEGDLHEAMRYTAMALALDPEDVSSWYRALCLSLVVPDHDMAMTGAERRGVVGALMTMDGADPGLEEMKDGWVGYDLKAVERPALPALCTQIGAGVELKTQRQTLDTMDVSP